MSVDQRLLHDIKFSEAPGGRAELVGYPDEGGVPTVGYGHTGPGVYVGMTITQAQADAWLEEDIEEANEQAAQLPEWASLNTACRRNAIIECVFNLGDGHWTAPAPHGFPKTRAAIQRQDWVAASANLLNSPEWIKQVHLTRVQRLADYLLRGSY